MKRARLITSALAAPVLALSACAPAPIEWIDTGRTWYHPDSSIPLAFNIPVDGALALTVQDEFGRNDVAITNLNRASQSPRNALRVNSGVSNGRSYISFSAGSREGTAVYTFNVENNSGEEGGRNEHVRIHLTVCSPRDALAECDGPRHAIATLVVDLF